MRRVLCWLLGHQKRLLRVNITRQVMLAHVHPHAGEDWDCTSCGLRWRDAEPIGWYHHVVFIRGPRG